MKKLPKKITPDPLISVVAEVRFDSQLDGNTMLSTYFQAFASLYKVVKPSDDIPSSIKLTDPGLKYRPHFVFYNDQTSFSFGPNVAFVEFNGDYPGWEKYFEHIRQHFEIVRNLNLVSSIRRVGLRFVNLFEGYSTLDEAISFEMRLSVDIEQNKRFYKCEISKEDMAITMQLAENATINKGNKAFKGIVLDIDSFIVAGLPKVLDEGVLKLFDRLHDFEKSVFYSLINDTHMKKLKVEY